jgi:hypothetical protein
VREVFCFKREEGYIQRKWKARYISIRGAGSSTVRRDILSRRNEMLLNDVNTGAVRRAYFFYGVSMSPGAEYGFRSTVEPAGLRFLEGELEGDC